MLFRSDGLGLGMSIVAAVVAAHGGRVRARTRPQGGLVVEVSLPPYAPAEHRSPAPAAVGIPNPAPLV